MIRTNKRGYRIMLSVLFLILMVGVILWYMIPEVVYVYHGPYATYTPVDLQIKRQKEYNEIFSWCNLNRNQDFWLRAAVLKRKDLDYENGWKEVFEENIRNGKKAIFSINTYTWLSLIKGRVPCDTTVIKDENGRVICHLRVIGYKKAERPYYLLRFITHRGGSFPENADEYAQASYILNVQEGSGSTHVTPEIYLLENCTKSLPDILLESKSNMVRELVANKPDWLKKRYLIGAISDSEYNELLDKEMKDSLMIRDVMVNIPHDPMVIIDEVWKKNEKVKNLFDRIINRRNVSKDTVCKYLIEKGLMESDKKRICYLQQLYRYYVSLGILRKAEDGNYYIHNPQYKNRVRGNGMNILPDSLYEEKEVRVLGHFYKSVYGNLQDHYYGFKRDTSMKLVVKKGRIVLKKDLRLEEFKKKLDARIGYRVYIDEIIPEEKQKKDTPIDTLIRERENLYKQKI